MKSSIKINILLHASKFSFTRQLPSYMAMEGFDFYENSQLDIVWDMVVSFEGMPVSQQIRCKRGGLIFISPEPPDTKRYANRFLNQFDHVISTQPKIKHANNHLSQPATDWWFGRNVKQLRYHHHFDQLENLPLSPKTSKISFIASNQSTVPGHIKRLKFLNAVKNTFGNRIDYFGRGFNQVDDKADALLPYMFSICIENSAIPHYWTEKIADPILGFTVPIYGGCLNLADYFSPNSYVKIDVDDIPNSLLAIEHILSNASKIYQDKLPALLESRRKLLHEYNMYGMLRRFYEKEFALEVQPGHVIDILLHPQNQYFESVIINKMVNQRNFIKRFRYKVLSKLKLISY